MTPEDREKIINEYNNIKNSNPLKKLSVKKYYDSLNNEKKMTFSYRTIQNWKHDLNINESKNIKKRIRFSKNIKMEISRKYWVEKDKYSTVNDFIENNYNIYSNSSIKNIIYTQEYKPLNELQEFKSYIYNGISTNEINNTIQSKELYKCLDLKVVEVPGLRFGVKKSSSPMKRTEYTITVLGAEVNLNAITERKVGFFIKDGYNIREYIKKLGGAEVDIS
jgi:hypothetical protein